MTSNKKSSGDRSELEVAASKAAFTMAVFLLGVPGCRPPRLSPGLDPLGIAIFATFLPNDVRSFFTKNGILFFNPGSAGPRRFRLPITVGRMTAEHGKLRAEIVELSVKR